MKTLVNQITKEITFLFPKLVRRIHSDLIVNNDITQSQMFVLLALHDRKQCTVGELARERGVSLPTITGIVDRLIRTKLVERVGDPRDRRVVLVKLTPKGKDVIKVVLAQIESKWEKCLNCLAPEEAACFFQCIQKVSHFLIEMEEKGDCSCEDKKAHAHAEVK